MTNITASAASDEPKGPVRQSSIVRVAAFIAAVGEGNKFKKLDLFEGVPGVSQADRRMRDLRPMGWTIDNYKVNPSLAPDEYLIRKIGTRVDLGERPETVGRRAIAGAKRRRVLERDGHACQVCGTAAGAEFVDAPGRTAVLSIGHIIPVARGGEDNDDNLRAECQRCNDEVRDDTVDPASAEMVLTRATNLGGRKKKLELFRLMHNGRHSRTDVEEVYLLWARLPLAQRLDVMQKFVSQVVLEED